MKTTLHAIVLALAMIALLAAAPLAAEQTAPKESSSQLSLVTATPDEGFALAVALARRAVVTVQPNKEVLFAERPDYSTDADSLISASQTVALYFQIIAAANDYWR